MKAEFSVPREEDWWDGVACAGEDPLTFSIPPGRFAVPKSYWDRAKSLCASCPVQKECLNYMLTLPITSLDLPMHHSMYAAGLTPTELNYLQRKHDAKHGGLR